MPAMAHQWKVQELSLTHDRIYQPDPRIMHGDTGGKGQSGLHNAFAKRHGAAPIMVFDQSLKNAASK